jgi:hypothetical protein
MKGLQSPLHNKKQMKLDFQLNTTLKQASSKKENLNFFYKIIVKLMNTCSSVIIHNIDLRL